MARSGKIYFPAKAATQSGNAKTHECIFEIEELQYRDTSNLMQWTSSDAKRVVMKFPSLERAIKYAEKEGVSFEILPRKFSIVMPKSYSSNFTRDPSLR